MNVLPGFHHPVARSPRAYMLFLPARVITPHILSTRVRHALTDLQFAAAKPYDYCPLIRPPGPDLRTAPGETAQFIWTQVGPPAGGVDFPSREEAWVGAAGGRVGEIPNAIHRNAVGTASMRKRCCLGEHHHLFVIRSWAVGSRVSALTRCFFLHQYTACLKVVRVLLTFAFP